MRGIIVPMVCHAPDPRDLAIRSSRSFVLAGLLILFAIARPALGVDGWRDGFGLAATGPCDACDANCDTQHDIADIDHFVGLLLSSDIGCAPCAGDLDGNDLRDGRDVQMFVNCLLAPPVVGACCTAVDACAVTTAAGCAGLWLGPNTTCESNPCAWGNLTAFRPQHGAAYFPFARTAVADAEETSATLGPGIRINAPGDSDPQGEDDLIEVTIEVAQPEIPTVLQRTHAALRVWLTRDKQPGSDVAFIGDVTLPLAMIGPAMTVWVEWADAAHGEGEIQLLPQSGAYTLDAIRFHTFHSVVLALGGEGQVPSVPVDANHGTFVVATALYGRGYDVHLYDEDNVSPNGSGSVLNEAVTAVAARQVSEIAIFGYSHGGGSTYDLAERLDIDRPGIGVFEIVVSSYVDAVENDSDFDLDQELRRPPSTQYHANHYQVGSFVDIFLDGGPVPNSNPPPTGLNVESTPWGAGSTHYLVDDYVQVRSYIQDNFESRLSR